MQYRRTRLVESIGLGPNRGKDADVDGHLKSWADAGWQLHTVTTISRDGYTWDIVHDFFWMKPERETPADVIAEAQEAGIDPLRVEMRRLREQISGAEHD